MFAKDLRATVWIEILQNLAKASGLVFSAREALPKTDKIFLLLDRLFSFSSFG